MRNRAKTTYLTAEQLEEQASARIEEAERLPPGEMRLHALRNAAQLRSYAAMKRLLVPERSSVAVKTDGASDAGS